MPIDGANIGELVLELEPPVLIISSHAGRGMYSIGEAIRTRHAGTMRMHHLPIEALLPPRAVEEDLSRYRLIASRFPWLLGLIYRMPFFYRRKYLREIHRRTTHLELLQKTIATLGARTVIAISHRAAFWAGALKQREGLTYQLWGLEAEYGPSLAWRYVFWEQMNGFLSPQPSKEVVYPFPASVDVRQVAIPVNEQFSALADHAGNKNSVLLTGGYWGLGRLFSITTQLAAAMPTMHIDVVCGENHRLHQRLVSRFGSSPNLRIFGVVDSMVPLTRRAGAVISKPGISTIAETQAARRQLFLLRGLPVAEDHNALYAVRHFGAQWFSLANLKRWYDAA